MSKEQTIAAIVGLALLIGILLYALGLFGEKHYDWYETYDIRSDEPYGLSYTIDLIDAFYTGETNIEREQISKVLDEEKPDSYLFIGYSPYYTGGTIDTLLNYVRSGHTAFIAANEFPDSLMLRLIPLLSTRIDSIYTLQEFETEDQQQHPSLITDFFSSTHYQQELVNDAIPLRRFSFRFRIQDTYENYAWRYFRTENFGTNTAFPWTASAKDAKQHTPMITFHIGDGQLHLYHTPILLTNLYMVDSANIPFLSAMFSYLPGESLVIDEFSKYYQNPGDGLDSSNHEAAGPLQFILSQPALRAAWYTLLAGLLLFMVFRSRREQQVIPITEPQVNRSLEFANTIGRMHYLRKEHLYLVQQQMRLWYAYVKEHYQLQAGDGRELFIQKLSLKSGVTEQSIRDILEHYSRFEQRQSLQEKEMMEFYYTIQIFYKNCI
jgi:hypothetical protein